MHVAVVAVAAFAAVAAAGTAAVQHRNLGTLPVV